MMPGMLLRSQNTSRVRDRRCLLAQDCQQNVDQEVRTTSALKEDAERWEDDGKNDLADIAVKNECQF